MKALGLFLVLVGLVQLALAVDVPTPAPILKERPHLKLKKHHYNNGDDIELWVNTVGPFSNPTETYEFYHLPLCVPDKIIKKSRKLGEVIQGDRAVLSDYKIAFNGITLFHMLINLTNNRSLCHFSFIFSCLPVATLFSIFKENIDGI